MKKIYIALILCIISQTFCAQEIDFSIQSDGSFINKHDNKEYIVLNYPDASKEELYSNILTSITKLYKSPKEVLSVVDDEIISINAIQEKCISIKALGIIGLYSIEYNIKFQFKDGRIKINSPIVSCFYDYRGPITPVGEWNRINGVFKKGLPNPKKQKTIDDFNNVINTIISSIVLDKNDNDDNW